jgi:hypothetical protein
VSAAQAGRRRLFVDIVVAFGAALKWRLLLAWTACFLLPTALAAFPFWRVLATSLDHCPRAAELAKGFDMLAFGDMGVRLNDSSAALTGAALASSLSWILLVPLVAGMILASARAERSLGFAALLQGGIDWYGRMFRILLVSLIPLALVGVVAALLFKAANRYAAHVTLESQADRASYAALAVTILLFVLVHATIEAGRAAFAADGELRSAWRAWLRGLRLTARRPLAVIGAYLAATIAGWLVTAGLVLVRLRVPVASGAGFWAGFGLTQVAVAAVGWGKATRLFALTAVARRQG